MDMERRDALEANGEGAEGNNMILDEVDKTQRNHLTRPDALEI